MPLAALWAERRRQQPLRSMLSAAPSPVLTFRAGPLPARPPPLLPYRLMPATLIAHRDTACMLAAARVALADYAAGSCGGAGDAALAALPHILDDDVLRRELAAKWDARVRGLEAAAAAGGCADCGDCGCSGGVASAAPSSSGPAAAALAQQRLAAALRTSALELSPLLHCAGSLPPPHIGNFAEHAQHRAAVVARFCRQPAAPGVGRAPVDALGGRCDDAESQWAHAPFDVAETRVCIAQQLAERRWCAR